MSQLKLPSSPHTPVAKETSIHVCKEEAEVVLSIPSHPFHIHTLVSLSLSLASPARARGHTPVHTLYSRRGAPTARTGHQQDTASRGHGTLRTQVSGTKTLTSERGGIEGGVRTAETDCDRVTDQHNGIICILLYINYPICLNLPDTDTRGQ